MRCRVNFNVVADNAVVTNDAVFLNADRPLSQKALRRAGIKAIAREYDLGIVDLGSITIEEVFEKAAGW